MSLAMLFAVRLLNRGAEHPIRSNSKQIADRPGIVHNPLTSALIGIHNCVLEKFS